jgi:hypothetical protein
LDNLIAACYACNRDKSDESAVTYRRLTKPLRVARENEAIAYDLQTLVVPMAGLTFFGFMNISEWWDDLKRRRQSGDTSAVEFRDWPWIGILAILTIILLVVVVVKANRGT